MLVDATGGRRWLLRTLIHGKRHDIGLGTVRYGDDELREVRRKARVLRDVARSGGDPLADKRAAEAAAAAAKSAQRTFREFATEYVEAHRPEWKNAKHAQWTSTLETYAYPVFGDIAVGKVDSAMVVQALRPIWSAKHETASRLRQRLETILGAAKALDKREGDNPAAWDGALAASLPNISRKRRIVNHPALPYREVAAFMQSLKALPGVAARALEFAILTAGRTNEVIGARWSEMDLEQGLFTLPAARMKAGKPHVVPLAARVVELVDAMPRTGEFVFPGRASDRALSNMAMLKVLERMGRDDITVHGFRATFRTWAGEETSHPREVIEHALAHQLADQVEAAYQRGDLLPKRRALMEDWARYVATARAKPADVVSIRKRSNTAA